MKRTTGTTSKIDRWENACRFGTFLGLDGDDRPEEVEGGGEPSLGGVESCPWWGEGDDRSTHLETSAPAPLNHPAGYGGTSRREVRDANKSEDKNKGGKGEENNGGFVKKSESRKEGWDKGERRKDVAASNERQKGGRGEEQVL